MNRLEDFIVQQEAVLSPVDLDEFDGALSATIKPPQSEDQTSHSVSRDDLTET